MADGSEVAALVARAADGDQRAYEALVDRYGRLVWSITRAHRLSDADAADVSQTAWLRLVEQLDKIREPERVGAWLATTTRHECLAVLRRGSRAVAVDPQAEGTPLAAGVTAAVESDALERRELAATVATAWADLPERCRVLLSLLLSDPPASYDEVTATLDMPVGSIGPTRQRCLQKLSQHDTLAGITGPGRDSLGAGSEP